MVSNTRPSNECLNQKNIMIDDDDYEDRHGDRPRGIMTRGDREFYSPESYSEEEDEQTIRNRRYRIRKRAISAIKDFDILSRFVSPEDREKIVKSVSNEDPGFLKQIGVFLYLEFDSMNISKSEYLEDVIKEAERRKGNCDIDVSVGIYKEGDMKEFTIKTTKRSESTEAD